MSNYPCQTFLLPPCFIIMMKAVRLPYLILLMFISFTFSCTQKAPDVAPSKEEVYHFFMSRMKQAAKAGGYLNYRLTINKFTQDIVPEQCNVQDENVPCFTVYIDRTETLDNYTGSYVSTFKNDVYHLYRDEKGHLAIADHDAGQTSTEQRHRAWRGNRL